MMSPEWIVGFTDGEGCFKFNIIKDQSKLGFEVCPAYEITLHEADIEVLKAIKEVLGVGNIQERNREPLRKRGIAASDNAVLAVTGIENCLILRDFFNKYPLQSKKKNDFNLWSQCLSMIQLGKHRTIHGFLEIVKIRDQMNTAGKARMITSGRYRNYEWFRSRLIGSTQHLG